MMESASKLFQATQYQASDKLYSSVIEIQPSARAFGNRSACRAKLGQFEEALSDAREALKLEPGNVKMLGRCGSALHGLKRYTEALDMYNQTLKLGGENATYSVAVADLKSLIAAGGGVASKTDRDAHYYKQSLDQGKQAMLDGKLYEAIRLYDKAVQLCPDMKDLPVLYCNRSAAHFRLCQYAKAAEDARSALDVGPGYSRAHLRLGLALQQQKKFDDALNSVDECIRLDPSNVQAATTREELIQEIERSNISLTEEKLLYTKKIKEVDAAKDAERQTARIVSGPVHANSYLHCNYCNAYGHSRSECPMRKKRPRDS